MRKIFIAAALAAISVNAYAIPVEWTFENVVYDDGSSTEGSFTYDADTGTFSNFNFTTVCGSLCSGTLSPSFVGSSSLGTGSIIGFISDNRDGTNDIFGNDFVFASAPDWQVKLTNAGGTVEIDNAYITEFSTFQRANIVSGSVSAVPIPAAVWLFGSALVGLGWMRRR